MSQVQVKHEQISNQIELNTVVLKLGTNSNLTSRAQARASFYQVLNRVEPN